LYIETSGRLEIDDEYDRNLMRNVPKTTTNADLEMLRRKFSHDHKFSPENVLDFFGKKQSIAGLEAYSGKKSSGKLIRKEEDKEGLDIGRALGGLKDRVSRLLGRVQEDRELLKNMHGKMGKLAGSAGVKK